MVKATKITKKTKTQPSKKGKKAPAKKKQLKKPVEEEEIPLPATRKSDDPIPKKVINCNRWIAHANIHEIHKNRFLRCRKNGLTNNVYWCLLHAASIIAIVI